MPLRMMLRLTPLFNLKLMHSMQLQMSSQPLPRTREQHHWLPLMPSKAPPMLLMMLLMLLLMTWRMLLMMPLMPRAMLLKTRQMLLKMLPPTWTQLAVNFLDFKRDTFAGDKRLESSMTDGTEQVDCVLAGLAHTAGNDVVAKSV
jgi:hypothetical protein